MQSQTRVISLCDRDLEAQFAPDAHALNAQPISRVKLTAVVSGDPERHR